jgi:class 3 adenylate cyclase
MKHITKKRQLAAIMFTDIVGYTALMGESEEKALHIRRINREIHRQQIEAVGGTWLKEMGLPLFKKFILLFQLRFFVNLS